MGDITVYRIAPVHLSFHLSPAGQWGTVCNDGWGFNESTVVCRQLGFPGAAEINDTGYYGDGSGIIWMDQVNCIGTERQLEVTFSVYCFCQPLIDCVCWCTHSALLLQRLGQN